MTDKVLVFCIIIVPAILGYVIPTIVDKSIKTYKEKHRGIKSYKERHKCKHIYTYWKKKPETSKFCCISGDTMILVCKDCGEVITESFWEHEGMGYK